MTDTRKIEVTVNGVRYARDVDTRLTLADFLRHHLGLTGPHLGCEQQIQRCACGHLCSVAA